MAKKTESEQFAETMQSLANAYLQGTELYAKEIRPIAEGTMTDAQAQRAATALARAQSRLKPDEQTWWAAARLSAMLAQLGFEAKAPKNGNPQNRKNPTKKTHAKHARNWLSHAKREKREGNLWRALEYAHFAICEGTSTPDDDPTYGEASDLALEIKRGLRASRNPQTRGEKRKRRGRLDATAILRKAMRGT